MESLTVVAAVIQAAAAVVALLVTLRLARVARETLKANERMARSAEAQIAVMREQMAIEYLPLIAVVLDDPTDYRYGIANVGKHAVGLTKVMARFGGYEFYQIVTNVIEPGQTFWFRFDDYMVSVNWQHRSGNMWVEFIYGSTGTKLWRLDHVRFTYKHPPGEMIDRGHVRPL